MKLKEIFQLTIAVFENLSHVVRSLLYEGSLNS